MPAKPLPTDLTSGPSKPKTKPTGPFVVINPRLQSINGGPFHKVPGFYIREGDKRWFEGDTYDGPKAEQWLGRGFIKRGKS